jgi:hypothetical protein
MIEILPRKLGELRGKPLNDWAALWVSAPFAWKQLVATFLERASKDEVICERLMRKDKPSEELNMEILCAQCGKDFKNKAALHMHERHAHGRTRLAKEFVLTGLCPSCGTNYHTRQRAIHHISIAAPRCRQAMLEGRLPRHTAEQVAEADKLETEARKLARKAGVSCMAGPPAVRRE